MAEAPPTSNFGEHVPAREALAPGHPHHGLALEVHDLWAGYAGQPAAIEAVDFLVPEGELVGVVGPNGAGKSTLFKSILGLVRPLRGEVRVFGRPVAEARADISYMPQVDEVDWDFPVSVRDVVLMGRWRHPRPFRRWTAEDRDHAAEAIERVGLADLAGRQVGRLSGGQRRRVLMARAIARGARLLLLDEPFAGLDAAIQHDLIAILDGLTRDGRSVLVATHDLSCVASSCDEACCLNRRVQGFGPPSEVLTEDVLTRTFQRHLLAVAHQPALVVAEDEHLERGAGSGPRRDGGA